jgi:TfoX/Sxy family transcriptional regulator of competence genes
MASDERTINYLVDQLSGAAVSAKKMFGDYGLFCDGRIVALVCDDRLFIKPTKGGRNFAPDLAEGIPYPGAKPCPLVDEERWDDADWLVELVLITANELPMPKPKSKARHKPKLKTG